MDFSGFDIAVIVLVALVVLVLFKGIKTIPQGYNYTVERFGRYTKTLSPGPQPHHALRRPRRRQDEHDGAGARRSEPGGHHPRQRHRRVSTASPSTRFSTRHRPPTRLRGLQNAILNLTMTNIRTVMGSMDLDELLSNRDAINERLLRVVDEAAHRVGHQDHPRRDQGHQPAGQPVESMGRQMKAERNKRAQILAARVEISSEARSSRSSRPRAARKQPSATPRRASARPKRRPGHRRWCRKRLPRATCRR